MPVKRRVDKRRPQYPETIQRLITGAPLEWSDTAWHELIGAFFFGDHNVPPEAKARARELLDCWRDQQLAFEQQVRTVR